jgi:hypothetical protein
VLAAVGEHAARPGLAADGRIRVIAHETASGVRRERQKWTEWQAFFPALVDLKKDSSTWDIARGNSLEQLRANLAKYLADEAAGTLRDRHAYGFSLDRRPVARIGA